MKVAPFVLIFTVLCSSHSFAASLDIETLSFDELLRVSRPINNTDSTQVEHKLWIKYLEAIKASSEHAQDINSREIKYGDKVMRYSFEQRGTPGTHGYPLYIALHGGGAAGRWLNDSQWEHMKVYYRDSVDDGIYIATRGITDTWNLHFVDESYPLYDRLITNLIAFANVDPNRVYITGFSAGGDGVYQIATRMPDRWAAANMSAGHSNWIQFDNLYNVPILLQVGSSDAAYSRNRNAPENALTLSELESSRGGYKHEMYLHYRGSHNSWRDNDPSGRPQTVITNLRDWLSGATPTTREADTNAIHWLKEHERNPYPTQIYWSYDINALRDYTPGAALVTAENRAHLTPPKNLLYWLSIIDADPKKAQLVHAAVSADNRIVLTGAQDIGHLRILLNDSLIDFDDPVTVVVDGKPLAPMSVQRDVQVMTRTLLERGDANYIFSAQIDIIKTEGLWKVATESTSYTYCSKSACKIITGPQHLFFGPLPSSVARTCVDSSMYALTFDDGPTEKWDALLPLLEQYGVRATFFVNGVKLNNAVQKARLVKAHQGGHQIANHSQNHRSLLELDAENIVQEVDETRALIGQALGSEADAKARIVRAPFGYSDQRVVDILERAGYRVVRWNSDRYDWELKADESPVYLSYFFKHLAFLDANTDPLINASMIDVNHDRAKATLDSLPTLITTLQARGYRFVTVSECLGV